ncbi:hypothetical protein F5876DRAFT_53884 [Lentinula aff. lateritia]|uniref:Uncharacterized protein n=1 Tax=Lentinula aff. lateritia TaxID=2804960 RepID=A0ACC1THC1_9AGAR|nr:hypothetical protein F5876DRAFT_53884 [Lentinula aff. lateritia]
MLLSTALKTKKSNFPSLARSFASVSSTAVSAVAHRLAEGDPISFRNSEEQTVSRLMEQANLVTSNVPGSSSSLVAMRNQIRALMTDQGLPSFYVTINPADVYNPVVKLLAGSDIDIDNMFDSDVPRYWDQAL